MITGINHIALAVNDLETSYTFYVDVLGCRPVAKWPQGAYLLAGSIWLGLVKDENVIEKPLPEYTHLCFSVEPKKFEHLAGKIKAAGSEIWQENTTEGESLYFLDPNGHKLEIHATGLKQRLEYARENPWQGLELFV
jgi:catechol 2,3-dioxygenase-like lactoylglutathione lyase family enzyme